MKERERGIPAKRRFGLSLEDGGDSPPATPPPPIPVPMTMPAQGFAAYGEGCSAGLGDMVRLSLSSDADFHDWNNLLTTAETMDTATLCERLVYLQRLVRDLQKTVAERDSQISILHDHMWASGGNDSPRSP